MHLAPVARIILATVARGSMSTSTVSGLRLHRSLPDLKPVSDVLGASPALTASLPEDGVQRSLSKQDGEAFLRLCDGSSLPIRVCRQTPASFGRPFWRPIDIVIVLLGKVGGQLVPDFVGDIGSQ